MPLPIFSVELNLGGDLWEDITQDARESQNVNISHGRRDWSSSVDPGKATFKFNNGRSNVNPEVSGRYSPRNPRSDLFGTIGRNTRVRVRIGEEDVGAFLAGFDESYVWAPDSAALSITGDIDVRAEIHPVSWRPGSQNGNIDGMLVASKFDLGTVFSDRTWDVVILESGKLRFTWSPDGSNTAIRVSTVPVPESSGRLAIRVVLDVDNGTGVNETTFYTAPSIDGPWTQLGDSALGTVVTSIHDNDQELAIGSGSDGGQVFSNFETFEGRVFNLEVRDGIDGTVVADPDFTLVDPSEFNEPFSDDAGNTWTFGDGAFIEDFSIRFSGEISTWPQRWDLSDKDVWVPVTADGIQRRLQIQDVPSVSSMFNDLSQREDVVAYYPMEESDTRSKFGSGLVADTTALSIQGRVFPGRDDTFPASRPLPVFNGGAKVDGALPTYIGADEQRVAFLVSIPSDGIDDQSPLISLGSSGTAARWELIYGTGGSVAIDAYDRNDTQVHSGASVGYDLDGKAVVFSLRLRQDGADINAQTSMFTVDAGEVSAVAFDETVSGETYGRFTSISVGNLGFDYEGATFGQVFILNDDVESIWDAMFNSIDAWSAEEAGTRIQRVSDDGDVPLEFIGTPGETETMGRQTTNKFIDILREARNSDIGILTERLSGTGMRYRTRHSLYNQTPRLVLDYEEGVVFDPFDPVDDDQFLRNHVTTKRVQGQEFRAIELDGPLSVLPPPEGVGVYEDSATISLRSDEQIVDQAYWRLHMGTVDEIRFPVIRFDLRNPRMTPFRETILSLREGDRIQVLNPPEWLPAKTIDLIIEGWDESVGIVTHEILFNCTPASVWTVGESFVVLSPESGLSLSGNSSDDYALSVDSANLDISGDIDLRVDATLDSWRGEQQILLAKYNIDNNDRAYGILVTPGGFLRLNWSEDGSTVESATSTRRLSFQEAGGRMAVRATLDVDKDGDHEAILYTARTIDGPWSQLGDTITDTGTTSINNSDFDLTVGNWNQGGGSNPAAGVIHYAEVRDGINGNIVANPDFAAQDTDTEEFTDSAGNTWTLNNNASIIEDFSLEPQAAVRYQPEGAMMRLDAEPDDEVIDIVSDIPGFTLDSSNMPFDIEVHGEILEVTSVEDGVRDQFDRVVSGTEDWGFASTGQRWANFGSTSGSVSVDGNSGILSVTNTASTDFRDMVLLDTESSDVMVELDFDMSELSTGANSSAGVRIILRAETEGADNFYSLDTLCRPDTTIDFRISEIVDGGFNNIQALIDPGESDIFAPIAGETSRAGMRFTAIGDLLIGNLWMKDNPSIMVTNIVRDDRLASGLVGIRAFTSADSTNDSIDFSVENYRVVNLQRFNVERGINGINQTLSAGDAIQMFNPTRYAL